MPRARMPPDARLCSIALAGKHRGQETVASTILHPAELRCCPLAGRVKKIAAMAPSVDVQPSSSSVDLSPQALIEEHYKANPNIDLSGVGRGLQPKGVR